MAQRQIVDEISAYTLIADNGWGLYQSAQNSPKSAYALKTPAETSVNRLPRVFFCATLSFLIVSTIGDRYATAYFRHSHWSPAILLLHILNQLACDGVDQVLMVYAFSISLYILIYKAVNGHCVGRVLYGHLDCPSSRYHLRILEIKWADRHT